MHRHPVSIFVDVLIAVVSAAIAVAAILPFSVFALLVCFGIVASATEHRVQDGRPRLAVCGAIAATLAFAGVVAAAAVYRPAKVVEQQLNRTVTLPEKRMTLAELAYHATLDRRHFPAYMSLSFADEDRSVVVEWPAREITLREFLAALEAQTELRHKFSHCGNGYTVLGGGDCSMGLIIFDPTVPRDRERFDLNAYVSLRDAAEQTRSNQDGTP